MLSEPLPLQDHTARYCPGSKLEENGAIAPPAFHLRKGEAYLSVEWLEYLEQPDRAAAIRAVIDLLSKKLRLGSSAKIAVLEVGAVCAHVRKETGYAIPFLHEPEPDDPAHSGIHDTAADEMLIAELIVEAVEDVYPVKAI